MCTPLHFRWKPADRGSAGFGAVELLLVVALSIVPILALANDRPGAGPGLSTPPDCCGNDPELRQVSFYVLPPGMLLFLGTNGGSPMLLQIEVVGTGQSAEVFVNCGRFLFSGAVTNDANGIAYKEIRDWGGCRLAIANVSARSSELGIGVSLVGQVAATPADLRPSKGGTRGAIPEGSLTQ